MDTRTPEEVLTDPQTEALQEELEHWTVTVSPPKDDLRTVQ